MERNMLGANDPAIGPTDKDEREYVMGLEKGLSIIEAFGIARGPLTLIARPSRICSGVSAASSDGDDVCAAVPKLPSRNSAAPDRDSTPFA